MGFVSELYVLMSHRLCLPSLVLVLLDRKQHPGSVATTTASPSAENISAAPLSNDQNDNEDPDDPLPASAATNEENETTAETPEHTSTVENLTEQMNLSSMQTDSQVDSGKSRILAELNSSQQQDNQVIIKNGKVNNTNSSILVHLNSVQTQNTSVTQEGTIGSSNSRILVQLDPTQNQNQPLILNSNANNGNSKIIVQLDAAQQHQMQSVSQSNSITDSSPSRILLHIDSAQTQSAHTALIHGGTAATNASRILLQLDPGQTQSLPPNTVFTVADAVHLAPLVDDVNLGSVTSQYIQLTAAQPDSSVASTNSVTSANNNVPLHIQLPMSAVQLPLSAISQQGSSSTAYELQSLSVHGQPGLMFTSTGFDVSSISY
jgi:hypothetical protein